MNATSSVSLAFDPLLPWEALAVLAGIGLVLVLLGLRAGARGTIWRAGSVAIVLAALANPALVEEQRKPIADIALIVTDDSDSMAIGDRRLQVAAAREALKKKLAQQEGLEVREATLPPSHIQIGSDRPGGTRLIETMRSALVDVPPERLSGVILLTDGQVHDVPAGIPPELGGAPLHALIAGKKGERDRLIVLEQSPRFGVVGRQVTAKFRVEDTAGGTAPVTVSVGGEVVRRLDVPVGQSVELPVVVGNPGANIVELEVGAGPNELTLDNNRALFTINGVRDRLRVLLVSGEPYQGERAWRNLLKSDPAVDLVHFTILRTPQKDDFTPVRELSLIVFPMKELFEQKLKEFDLIIFDRYESGNLITRDYFRNIAEYVRSGGALLVSVGPVFATQRSLYRTPLGAILPAAPLGDVVEAGFKSGALNTANLAAAINRPVGAFPGQIDVPNAAGSNLLIRDGQILLGSIDDAITLAGLSRNATTGRQALGGDEADLWAALDQGEGTLEQLTAVSGLEPRRALEAVGRLELAGLVSRGHDGVIGRATVG